MLPAQFLRPVVRSAILVGIAYLCLASVAISYTRLNDNVALIWVATAPLLAALCVSSPRNWWMFVVAGLLGSLAATLLTSPYTMLAPVFAIANAGEALIAALVLQRMNIRSSLFVTTRTVPLFLLAGGILAPAISGIPVAWAIGVMSDASLVGTWANWLIGHGLGTVIGTPLALLLLNHRSAAMAVPSRPDTLRATGVAALVAAVSVMVFSQDRFPMLFLPILPVLVATFTLRSIGAAGSIAIVATIGAVMTLAGHGPIGLVRGDEALQLQFFQFYVGTLFVVALPVATTLIQRDALLRALSTSEARYRLIADNATDIMLTLAPDGRIEYVSQAIRELGYFEPAALIGRNGLALVMDVDRDRVRATHLQSIAAPDRTFRVEYRARKANGDSGWFESKTRAVVDDLGIVTAVVSTIRDLDQRKAREQELERAASIDPMTGLLNREVFRHSVGLALHRARRDPGRTATLALLDLDHFKAVNDTHGHATGDNVILLLADLLRANLRATDQVGRVGGEEFAILFDGIGADDAAASCDRMRIALGNQPIPCGTGTFRVTASIGLVEIAGTHQIDALFAQADAALYLAKRAGRNRVELAA